LELLDHDAKTFTCPFSVLECHYDCQKKAPCIASRCPTLFEPQCKDGFIDCLEKLKHPASFSLASVQAPCLHLAGSCTIGLGKLIDNFSLSNMKHIFTPIVMDALYVQDERPKLVGVEEEQGWGNSSGRVCGQGH